MVPSMPIRLKLIRQSHQFGCIPACLAMVFLFRQHSVIISQEQLQVECGMLTERTSSLWLRLKDFLGLLPPDGVDREGVVSAIRKHNFGVDILCRSSWFQKFKRDAKFRKDSAVNYYEYRSRSLGDLKKEAWKRLDNYIESNLPVIVIIPNFQNRDNQPAAHALVIYKVEESRVFYLDPAADSTELYYSEETFLEVWQSANFVAYIVR